MASAAALILSAMSCSKIIGPEGDIHLSASMGYVPTKGTAGDKSGIRDYDYDEELAIGLVRIDENEAGSAYPEFKNCAAPLEATLGRPNFEYKRDVEFTSVAQYFRNDVDHIRYASWYPVTDNYSFTDEHSKLSFNVDGATDILYGTVAEGSKTDGFSDIVFNHALCQFNIYVYSMTFNEDGTPSEGDIDWGIVNEIVVKNVQDKCIVTLPRSESDDKYTFEYLENNLYNLDLKTADNIYWDPGTDIPAGFDSKRRISTYIAPPPVNGYITFEVNTTTQDAFQKVSIARNFQRGCAYDIILRFTSHGIINAEVSVGKWNYQSLKGGEKITQDVAADMYYDLSAYAHANCYIIPSGNYGYSFVGNVEGKSDVHLETEPGYIDVLWCDNPDIWDETQDPEIPYTEGGNYFQLATHTLSKNRIMFKVGDIKDPDDKRLLYKGNVIVAAYRDNSKSEILWTWHLWLNDSVSAVGFTNGYLVLNQDVGATAPGNPGLYYQWGRKDPFIPGYFTTSSATTTLADAAKHPTVFYGAGGTKWFTEDISDFHQHAFTTNNGNDASIYDPCPSGYFVPDSRMWSPETIAVYEKEYNVGNYVLLEVQNSAVKFPLSQGYLDENGVERHDKPLIMWSITLDRNSNAPYIFTYPSSGRSITETEPYTNYGATLRCIAKAPAAVKDLSAVQTANCYVISKDGSYKFKGNIVGNGVSVLVNNLGAEWDMTGVLWGSGAHVDAEFEPDRIDYLWYQPALDGEIPSSITSDDICVKILNDGKLDNQGYINLEVVDWKPGNLIVAAYKGSSIVWSWHLWLTDEPGDGQGAYYSMMDRNLGATSATPATSSAGSAMATYGFYYQWGRKDPIVGPSGASGLTGSTASSTWFEFDGSSWTRKSAVSTIAGPVDVKVATANPQKQILSSSVHWMEGYSDDAPNKYRVAALWGYACDNGGWGNKPTKTLYDPCPPGYMVAHHWAYWVTPGQGTNGVSSGSDFSASGSYGYTWSRYSGLYFPLAGIRARASGNVTNVGTYGELWHSTPNSAVGRYTCLGGSFWQGLYKNTPDAKNDPANAMSVRCLKQ